jgi:hypothetical protein
MIFEIKVTATIKVDTNDYKEYDDQDEISKELNPQEIIEVLFNDWDQGVLDVGELLEDPETLTIELFH